MSIFQIHCKDCNLSAILDYRYESPKDITDGSGRFGSLVYTLLSEDITTADKPEFVPYEEHYAGYDTLNQGSDGMIFLNQEFETELRIQEYQDRLVLDMECKSEKVSSCGMFLPLNFMSCKNGEYESQFLISSPYHTADKKQWMHYFTRPDGKNLVLVAEGDLDGYKVNYSPYLSGHFIRGFSFLWQLDRAYGLSPKKEHRMRVHILPVESYEEAIQKSSAIWKLPAVYYDVASGKIGTRFLFRTIGEVDSVRVVSPSGKRVSVSENMASQELDFVPEEYGFYTIVPIKAGKAGMDASMFAWDDTKEMYRRAMDSLTTYHEDIIGETKDGTKVWRPTHIFYRGYHDHNLCEHGMWCFAMLRYMRAYGRVESFEKEVRNFLRIVLADESGVCLNCCSFSKEQGYRTKNSTRIQEAYSGVNLLLDAYQVFEDRMYLEYAEKVLRTRLEQDLSPEGAILRHGSDGETAEIADYTTVTCMVFPVVDLVVLLKKMEDTRYVFFEEAALRIADFVVKRGFSFPTEGGEHPEVHAEMEEGSIACSALTVLYVAKYLCGQNIRKRQMYLDFAGRLLKFHDAFTVYTQHPVLFRSSLRWWETIWEGDGDGPAVCFGHAWSIWRAEAQFLYGLLCHDNRRLLDSYNGFFGNYAKEDREGKVYAIYQYEPLSGGAVAKNGREMEYHVHDGFPNKADDTTSRYLFARDFQCWQRCAAVVEVDGKTFFLGCHMEEGEILFDGISLEWIYIGVKKGTYVFRTEKEPEWICSEGCRIEKKDGIWNVTVENGKER